MIIAVDFDGTCVTHEFPEVGQDIGAQKVLKRLVEHGHLIILWTMRSNGQEYPYVLVDAVQWFMDNDIPLRGINKNPTQSWSDSPKAYANLYIDDAALGCPLRHDEASDRPYVDWRMIESWLEANGWFAKDQAEEPII